MYESTGSHFNRQDKNYPPPTHTPIKKLKKIPPPYWQWNDDLNKMMEINIAFMCKINDKNYWHTESKSCLLKINFRL